jgi:hypothetical protein
VKPVIDVRSGLGEGTTDENTGDSQVIQGSFSYTAPDGSPISLKYDHMPNTPLVNTLLPYFEKKYPYELSSFAVHVTTLCK